MSRSIDLTPEEVFAILAHPYRRYVLAYLDQQRRAIPLDRLATKVASWDRDVAVEDVDDDAREQVLLSLYHTHIPKLEDAGLVEHRTCADVDAVELVANIEPLKPSLNAGLDEEFREFYTT